MEGGCASQMREQTARVEVCVCNLYQHQGGCASQMHEQTAHVEVCVYNLYRETGTGGSLSSLAS